MEKLIEKLKSINLFKDDKKKDDFVNDKKVKVLYGLLANVYGSKKNGINCRRKKSLSRTTIK